MTQFPVAHPRATARSRVFAIVNNPDLIAVVIVALLGLLATLVITTVSPDGAFALFPQF